jgi:hypothetical protein
MSGAIHPLPQYAFMAWRPVKVQRQLYLYFKMNTYGDSKQYVVMWKYLSTTYVKTLQLNIWNSNTEASTRGRCLNVKRRERNARGSRHRDKTRIKTNPSYPGCEGWLCFELVQTADTRWSSPYKQGLLRNVTQDTWSVVPTWPPSQTLSGGEPSLSVSYIGNWELLENNNFYERCNSMSSLLAYPCK